MKDLWEEKKDLPSISENPRKLTENQIKPKKTPASVSAVLLCDWRAAAAAIHQAFFLLKGLQEEQIRELEKIGMIWSAKPGKISANHKDGWIDKNISYYKRDVLLLFQSCQKNICSQTRSLFSLHTLRPALLFGGFPAHPSH